MFLSKKEERMLKGEDGPAAQWAMSFLVEYGEALGAEKLIDISSVAVGWCPPFQEILPPDVFSDLLTRGFKVPAYSLLIGVERKHWMKLGIPKEEVEKQRFMDERAKDIGLALTSTCAPYTVGYMPTKGSHCSVVEASLIPFVNSVLGARTLRESSQSVIASGIVGKSPNAGFHLDENRGANILVKVKTRMLRSIDFDLLGYHVGELVGVDVPAFIGIRKATLENLKYLCASFSASGGIGLFHIIGVTPEAPTLKAAFRGNKPKEAIDVTGKELEETKDKLCTGGSDKVDLVVFGCPHYTIEEVGKVARLLRGRRIHDNVTLWIFTPHSTRTIAELTGLESLITSAGGMLLSDTCPWVLRYWVEGSGLPEKVRVVATDSTKMAHYLPALYGVDVWYGSTESCVKAALTGVWES